jgi:hypothetical protein
MRHHAPPPVPPPTMSWLATEGTVLKHLHRGEEGVEVEVKDGFLKHYDAKLNKVQLIKNILFQI